MLVNETVVNETTQTEKANPIVKKERIAKVKAAKKSFKKEKSKVVKASLSKYADRLKDFKPSEKNQKSAMYVYGEDFSQDEINGKKGKQFRSSKRNTRDRFANNILSFELTGQKENLQKEIKLFISFYKKYYVLNDYSLVSISQGDKEKSKHKNLSVMLEIVKDSK